jgi:hypothetical protein
MSIKEIRLTDSQKEEALRTLSHKMKELKEELQDEEGCQKEWEYHSMRDYCLTYFVEMKDLLEECKTLVDAFISAKFNQSK